MNTKKMKLPLVVAAMKKLKLVGGANLEEKAAILAAHFDKRPSAELVNCEEKDGGCGANSTEEFEDCPYCGMEGVVEPNVGEPKPLPKVAAKPAPKPEEKKAAVKPPAKVVATATGVLLSDKVLDEAVERVGELKRAAAGSIWDLANEIRKIHEGELWKRRIKDGKAAYKSWNVFAVQELGMSHTHAYSLIKIAQEFKRADVEDVGSTKLKLLVGIEDKKQRAGLLNQARSGASTSKIRSQVNEIRAGSGGGSKKATTSKSATSKVESKSEPPADVSVMVRVGETVELVMNDMDGKGPVGVAAAKKLGAWAVESHDNGVQTRYELVAKGENLALKITRRRK